MTVQTLSKEAEQRIIRAAGDTVDLVLQGMHPTDAIVKVAKALRLPQGHSRLVARAYNVAKTNQQRETGSTLLEKTADFPLADGDAAEDRLFPKVIQKAACTEVSTEYLLPPSFLLEKAATARLVENVKETAQLLGTDKPTARPAYYNNKTAAAVEQQTRMQFEQARAEASAAFDKLAATFSDLQLFFKNAKQCEYADTTSHADLMVNQSSLLALALIRKSLPDNVKQAKESTAVHSQHQHQYVLLGNVKRASEDWAGKLHKVNTLREALPDRLPKREAKKMASESILGSVKTAAGFAAGLVGSLAGVGLGQNMKGVFDDYQTAQTPDYNAAVDAIHDPQHEATLKNIRTQAMLHSLMLHDPVVKGHDPREVLSAFSELSETAPRLSDQVLIMQPLLRKRLTQGVLDPFEVSQVMQMERQQPQPSQGGPSRSIMQ